MFLCQNVYAYFPQERSIRLSLLSLHLLNVKRGHPIFSLNCILTQRVRTPIRSPFKFPPTHSVHKIQQVCQVCTAVFMTCASWIHAQWKMICVVYSPYVQLKEVKQNLIPTTSQYHYGGRWCKHKNTYKTEVRKPRDKGTKKGREKTMKANQNHPKTNCARET